MLSMTAVGWRALGSGDGGTIRYFHLPMLVFLFLGRSRLPLANRLSGLVTAVIAYTLIYTAFSAYHDAPPYAAQQGVYLIAAFTLAAFIWTAGEADLRALRWAGPLAVGAFILLFTYDAAQVGVDVVSAYSVALRSGDLNLIQFGIFQPAFNASTYPVVVNSAALRGQIIAGVVICMYVSAYAQRQLNAPRSLFDLIYWPCALATGVIVLLTLARSLLLSCLLGPAAALGRLLLRSRARPALFVAGTAGALIAAVFVISPLATIVYERIVQDTGSYEERSGSLEFAIDAIASAPLIGQNTGGDALALQSGDRSTLSAHNFVLDAAVNGGVLTALSALAVMAVIFTHLFTGWRRFLRGTLPLAPLAAGLFAPVIMFTAGSGTLAMPEAAGLGLFYGALLRPHPTGAGTPAPGVELYEATSVRGSVGVSAGNGRHLGGGAVWRS